MKKLQVISNYNKKKIFKKITIVKVLKNKTKIYNIKKQ